MNAPAPPASVPPILSVAALQVHFGGEARLFGRSPVVKAVDGVSFDVGRGKVVGLVGESGSGKTTVGRSVLRLANPTSGRVLFDGQDITTISQAELLPLRRRMQMIFQDPFASLNPRLRIETSMVEALSIHRIGSGRDRRDRAAWALERVGLTARHLRRYPHEMSGGQRQRVVIARALALEPEFIVADEPVSALDVSIQAQIVNLLSELQRAFDLSILMISHDLSVVEYFCDEVVVMYLGRVMERAPAEVLFERPHHPYTRALLSAAPNPEPGAPRRRIVLEGDVPSPVDPPPGCVFHTRCPFAIEACRQGRPMERVLSAGHTTACIRDDLPD